MAALSSQVVLITGCSTGIGRALAGEFARKGHRVIATARTSDSLFSDVHESIEARAQLSQQNGTPTDEFARHLVAIVTRRRAPAVVRLGNGSRMLPVIGRLPLRLRDWFLGRRFGLEGLQ